MFFLVKAIKMRNGSLGHLGFYGFKAIIWKSRCRAVSNFDKRFREEVSRKGFGQRFLLRILGKSNTRKFGEKLDEHASMNFDSEI